MFGFRRSRISSVLLLALFSGAGYLVGTNAQRADAPELANGSATETPTLDPDFAWTPDPYANLPRGWVLIHGGSDHVFNRSGVLVFPSDIAGGVFPPPSTDNDLMTAGDPDPCSGEFFYTSMVGFY